MMTQRGPEGGGKTAKHTCPGPESCTGEKAGPPAPGVGDLAPAGIAAAHRHVTTRERSSTSVRGMAGLRAWSRSEEACCTLQPEQAECCFCVCFTAMVHSRALRWVGGVPRVAVQEKKLAGWREGGSGTGDLVLGAVDEDFVGVLLALRRQRLHQPAPLHY